VFWVHCLYYRGVCVILRATRLVSSTCSKTFSLKKKFQFREFWAFRGSLLRFLDVLVTGPHATGRCVYWISQVLDVLVPGVLTPGDS
jgi:hypothetical protein